MTRHLKKSSDRTTDGRTRAVVHPDPSDVVIELVVWIIGIVAMIVVLYPVLNVVALSMSDFVATISNPSRIIPGGFNLRAYDFLLFGARSDVLFRSLNVTVTMVGVGTGLSMFVTIMLSYTISRRSVPGVKALTRLVVLSGVFSPGFIAVFLVLRWMNLYNTFWALVIPGLMNMYHIIILKSFFQQVPVSLEDSAVMDGAGYFRILWQIYVPISKPAIATILLFTMVTYWNSFLNAVLYTRDARLWTIQLLLREVVITADSRMVTEGGYRMDEVAFMERVRYAMVILTTVPILVIYPFIQKYFAHGIMLGSLKG